MIEDFEFEVNFDRKFPYRFCVLSEKWVGFLKAKRHAEVTNWLSENIGERNQKWHCNVRGWYYFKNEEDATAFKLVWT